MADKTIKSVKRPQKAGIDWRNTVYDLYTTGGGTFDSATKVNAQMSAESFHLISGLSTLASIWISSGDLWIEQSTATKNVKIFAGSGGQIMMPNLPTADPEVAGALWSDGGTIKLSAG